MCWGELIQTTLSVVHLSHYAEMVRDARRQRRAVDEGLLDWVVVRNRLSPIPSRNRKNLLSCIRELSLKLGFRIAEGITERVIFREYFPMGLTALDDHGKLNVDGRESSSNITAREEVHKLLRTLRLPIDEQGKERARTRKLWLRNSFQSCGIARYFRRIGNKII